MIGIAPARERRGRARGERQDDRVRRDRRAPRRVIAVADPIKATSARRSRRLARWGSSRACSPGTTRPRRSDRARGRESTRVVAGVLPDGKVAEIQRLQAEGHRRRDGRRWNQRCAGARAGGRRDRDRVGNGRRGRGERRDADARRPRRRCDAIAISRAHDAHDAPEPFLGIRLQRRSASRSRRACCIRRSA